MQINGVVSGYSDPTMLGKRAQGVEGAGSKLVEKLISTPGGDTSRAEALGEIVSQYDVTSITPTEFSEMMQQLYQANVLSLEELQEMTKIRVDLDRAGISPDENVNLLEFYQERLHRLEIAAGGPRPEGQVNDQLPALQSTRQRLDWLQKLAVVQSAPEQLGLDQFV